MILKPKAGFDWNKVAWGRPDSPRSALCSCCFTAIGEHDVPLILWNKEGWTAQFCDACMRDWWGLETFEGGDPDE